MNKMLVAVFDTDKAADAGLNALRKLHTQGDITLYSASVIARDADGKISVKAAMGQGLESTSAGLAVGALIGLLGGPVGMAVGALTGTVVGAVRDFWLAGVDLDFVEQAAAFLKPGKMAVVAEIEEEWVTPLNSAIEAANGTVFRRPRTDVVEAQFDCDIVTLKAEITQLEAEAARSSGAVMTKLHNSVVATQASLDAALHRANLRVDVLKREADAKAASLKAQLQDATGEAKARLEHRVDRVKSTYHARSVKLQQAWGLARQALTIAD
ncbi:hypothetical protein BH11PSE7_BH11PSE7_17760 [soil metagenome]